MRLRLFLMSLVGIGMLACFAAALMGGLTILTLLHAVDIGLDSYTIGLISLIVLGCGCLVGFAGEKAYDLAFEW